MAQTLPYAVDTGEEHAVAPSHDRALYREEDRKNGSDISEAVWQPVAQRSNESMANGNTGEDASGSVEQGGQETEEASKPPVAVDRAEGFTVTDPTQTLGTGVDGEVQELQCGCSSYDRYKDYLDGFEKFKDSINKALKDLKPRQQQYDVVSVLIIIWEQSDIGTLVDNAKDLHELLRDVYGYNVDIYSLENKDRDASESISQKNARVRVGFRDKLRSITDAIQEEQGSRKLFIMYYVGHGAERKRKGMSQFVWQPTAESPIFLDWMEFRGDLSWAFCDVLFVFDCCYAVSLVPEDEDWKQRCELFGASGAMDQASADPSKSFTAALIDELWERKNSKGVDVLWYYLLLTRPSKVRNHRLNPAPVWHRYSDKDHEGSILLESKKLADIESPALLSDKDSGVSGLGRELDALNDTRILIKIRLTNPADVLLESEWLRWFQDRPSNVGGMEMSIVEKVRCQGLFDSNSTLALFSVPLWLWKTMQEDPVYEYLGVIRSENLLTLDAAPWLARFDEKVHGFSDLEGMKKWEQDLRDQVANKDAMAEERLREALSKEELVLQETAKMSKSIKDVIKKEHEVNERDRATREREKEVKEEAAAFSKNSKDEAERAAKRDEQFELGQQLLDEKKEALQGRERRLLEQESELEQLQEDSRKQKAAAAESASAVLETARRLAKEVQEKERAAAAREEAASYREGLAARVLLENRNVIPRTNQPVLPRVNVDKIWAGHESLPNSTRAPFFNAAIARRTNGIMLHTALTKRIKSAQ